MQTTYQPRGPPRERGENFFHMPRFQANEHLQYRHHFGGIHSHRFHNNYRHNKPFIFHNRNHEPMDPDKVLRQSFRDNFRDLATGGGRYKHRPARMREEGSHEDANIVELPGGFNAKQIKKPAMRKTVDYNSSMVIHLENRLWQRDFRDRRSYHPDKLNQLSIMPPQALIDNPMNAVATRHIRTSVNKNKCPIFTVAWTPEGRRLVTGAHSGEFVLWNGLTFNFETILQAHDTSVRAMKWSHNDLWMITADHNGFIKYWQSNMNNVKMFQAHKESIRELSFCPSDTKFASCSDDGTVRIWDFAKCTEERILRGHGADVKCVDWHPQKSIVISGSKDAQQPIKLWDPRTGVALTTLHAHKNTCMDVKWNVMNGHLFLTASRDHLIKLFDVRNMREDVLTYKGHKKEVTCVAWNPIHESLFASAGSDGSIMYWTTSGEKEVGCMHQAHDGLIWSLNWHPVGHILASGSNDHCVKFWGRNRLGDTMRDRYNLNLNPTGLADDENYDETAGEGVSLIPGMGIEQPSQQEESVSRGSDVIPGFEWTDEDLKVMAQEKRRETVYYHKPKPLKHTIRPVPESFERAWESGEQTVVTPKVKKDGMNVADLVGAPITIRPRDPNKKLLSDLNEALEMGHDLEEPPVDVDLPTGLGGVGMPIQAPLPAAPIIPPLNMNIPLDITTPLPGLGLLNLPGTGLNTLAMPNLLDSPIVKPEEEVAESMREPGPSGPVPGPVPLMNLVVNRNIDADFSDNDLRQRQPLLGRDPTGMSDRPPLDPRFSRDPPQEARFDKGQKRGYDEGPGAFRDRFDEDRGPRFDRDQNNWNSRQDWNGPDHRNGADSWNSDGHRNKERNDNRDPRHRDHGRSGRGRGGRGRRGDT